MNDPIPAIRGIVGWPAECDGDLPTTPLWHKQFNAEAEREAETVIQNRDYLTEARLNLTRAQDDDESPLDQAEVQAFVALATKQDTANRIAWYNSIPRNSPTAQLLAAQIEEELGVQS